MKITPITDVDGKKNSKDLVILALAKEHPLTIRQLHDRLKLDRPNVSYHAVHKAAGQLLRQGVLRKERKNYMLSTDWIENISAAIQRIAANCLYKEMANLPSLAEFKENETRTFVFETLEEADKYRKMLQCEYLEKKGPKPPYCGMSRHLRSPLIVTERSFNLLTVATKSKSEVLLLVSEDTPLDEWCADYYRNELIFVQTGVPCAQNCDIMVLGDVVTQLHLPQKIHRYIDDVYARARNISEFDSQEFYRLAYATKGEIRFVVTRNAAIAEQLRQQVLSNFKREKIAIFDINECLVDGFFITDFADYLAFRGHFDKACSGAIKAAWMQYKKGEMDYGKAADLVIEKFAEGLNGQNVKLIRRLFEEFVEEGRLPLFNYSRRLFNLVRSYCKTLAITKCPLFAGAMRSIFPFDFILDTRLGVKDDVYTGKIVQSLSGKGKKEAALKEWLRKTGASLKGSLGFGDSHHDLAFLNLVSHPFVLNPGKEMRSIAKKKKWPVFDQMSKVDDIVASVKKELKSSK